MTNQNKISSILDMMNDLQENLLALPDDMLLSIDSRENDSLEEGMQFIKAFCFIADDLRQHPGIDGGIRLCGNIQ